MGFPFSATALSVALLLDASRISQAVVPSSSGRMVLNRKRSLAHTTSQNEKPRVAFASAFRCMPSMVAHPRMPLSSFRNATVTRDSFRNRSEDCQVPRAWVTSSFWAAMVHCASPIRTAAAISATCGSSVVAWPGRSWTSRSCPFRVNTRRSLCSAAPSSGNRRSRRTADRPLAADGADAIESAG